MNINQRLLTRIIAVLIQGAAWLLLFLFVLRRIKNNHPIIISLIAAYILFAYIILPFSIRLVVRVTRKNRIPKYTMSPDGWPADPVNLVIFASYNQLVDLFISANWFEADTLNIKSSMKMVKSFVFNKPYQTAPFSSLFLFSRKQDVGFQKPIGDSPRKRHHIRFWVAKENPNNKLDDMDHWLETDKFKKNEVVAWIGAGTKDVGLGFTPKTLQISHSVDKDSSSERQYLVNNLMKTKKIKRTEHIKSSVLVNNKLVNKFVTDGKITVLYIN